MAVSHERREWSRIPSPMLIASGLGFMDKDWACLWYDLLISSGFPIFCVIEGHHYHHTSMYINDGPESEYAALGFQLTVSYLERVRLRLFPNLFRSLMCKSWGLR